MSNFHFQDITSYYRFCKGDTILDNMASYANLDIPFIMEQLTRGGVGLLTQIPVMMDNLNTYLNGPQKNYYEAGVVFAQIYQIFTDQHVNNWEAIPSVTAD